jgi:CheY-like chemotaxis protein
MMAGMNGHDTFYALRKAAPNIRIIMMSGLIEEKELKGILAEPLTAFIQKPFSKTLLMREISALCDTK